MGLGSSREAGRSVLPFTTPIPGKTLQMQLTDSPLQRHLTYDLIQTSLRGGEDLVRGPTRGGPGLLLTAVLQSVSLNRATSIKGAFGLWSNRIAAQVATCRAAANLDPSYGHNTALDRVGKDGMVTVQQEAPALNTVLEVVVEGISCLYRLVSSSAYSTTQPEPRKAILEDAYHLLTDKTLYSPELRLPILQAAVACRNKAASFCLLWRTSRKHWPLSW